MSEEGRDWNVGNLDPKSSIGGPSLALCGSCYTSILGKLLSPFSIQDVAKIIGLVSHTSHIGGVLDNSFSGPETNVLCFSNFFPSICKLFAARNYAFVVRHEVVSPSTT